MRSDRFISYIADSPRVLDPISTVSSMSDTKIFPSPAKPVLNLSSIVSIILLTKESFTTSIIRELTLNSGIYNNASFYMVLVPQRSGMRRISEKLSHRSM